MKDKFNREIDYLRLSVTDLCNLKCRYCVNTLPEKVTHNDVLSIEDMTKVVKACVNLGVKKVRITGGEPLVKKGLIDLIKQISPLVNGNIAITTNGQLLSKMAKDLKDAGLTKINVSLDTLDPKLYMYLSFGDLNNTLEGLQKAYELGFKIKINAVLQKDINDNKLDELLAYCDKIHATLRFIELMPFKSTEDYFEHHYTSTDEMIKRYNLVYKYSEGTAEYYSYKDKIVGFIRPISNRFCSSCNRIRVTSFGEFIPCLHSKITYSLKEYLSDTIELENKIKEYIGLKPEHHHLDEGERQEIDMIKIGG